MYASKYAPTAAESHHPSAPVQQAPVNSDPSFAQTQSEDDLFSDDITYVDEFAQTREPDSLFDDEFTPVTPQTVVEHRETGPQSLPASTPSGPRSQTTIAPRGGRGRGRGQPNRAPNAEREQGQPNTSNDDAEETTPIAPAAPAAPPERPAAVRGDRTATGGVQKAKLTEEELEERMKAISLKNNSLLAAHARAEADAASFAEREARDAAQAARRKKEDRVNRQQMMGEREKNRQRKLNAAGVREWDMAKKEADFDGRDAVRGSGNRRGMHGGVSGAARGDYSGYATKEQDVDPSNTRETYRGRGRGGRGRNGPRRGGGPQRESANGAEQQAVPTSSDFPELPPGQKPASTGQTTKLAMPRSANSGGDPKGQKKSNEAKPEQIGGESTEPDTITTDTTIAESSVKSSIEGKRSWADQVEADGS
ncbi:MAG: hypothetical protein M1820_001304 [Bogoriella megaspora]|nr:MAG: hypothetical protein M1820_001304 [Bogoriella megaspora]